MSLPLELNIKFQFIFGIIRLYSDDINPLLKALFILSQNLDSTVIYSWLSYVKHVLEETDMKCTL